MEKILEVRDLKKYFPVTRGLIFSRIAGWVKAVDGISFSIKQGETFTLAGESGCGKTTTAKVILLLEKITAGAVLFQDPYSSLEPRMRVGSIVAEPLKASSSMSKLEIKTRVEEALTQVGLNADAARLFPHEFSGGQRQRIAVARAVSLHPALIVLDEPVSALDVSIRAQIMNLLKDLQEQLGISYLLIAHNLATVRYMSHQVGIMYLGKLVERSPGEELFTHALHPYTKALLSAALPCNPDIEEEEIQLPGEVPSPLNPPGGCRFHPRCPQAMGICSENEPQLKEQASNHLVACHLY
jgi:oligopeptide/dipeptide ABC transporter ATP-binding protein